MAALLALLLVAAPEATLASRAPPRSGEAVLSLEERAFVASKIYQLLPLEFAHWNSTDVDLDTAYRSYLAEALPLSDRRAFDLATMRFVASLHDAHTWFDDGWLWKQDGRPLGFKVRHLQAGWVVTQSAIAGLAPGDLIETLDGEPFQTFVTAAEAHVGGASPRQREDRVVDWAGILFPERFVLGLGGGRRVTVERGTSPAPTSREPEGRWLAPGVGYLRIPSFTKSAFEDEALALVRHFSSARALVIDVRGNDGGTSPVRLTDALMDRPYRGWAGTTRLNLGIANVYVDGAFPHHMLGASDAYHHGFVDAFGQHFRQAELHWESSTTSPGATLYRGPLFLLVDRGCGSACEDFVMPFKDNGRAQLVGEATAGNDGQPYWYFFRNGMGVVVGAVEDRFPDGSPFDGIGIAPDVQVEPTIQTLRAGRDLVLERAEALCGVTATTAPGSRR